MTAKRPPVRSDEGWHGRYYEDFRVGAVYRHPLGRSITAADNIWFTLLTQNTAALHFDHVYAAQTEFGRPLVNSCLVLSLVTGQSVTDVSQNVMANLGWDEVTLPHPVFEGDTIYSESEVLSKRPSTSRPNVGVLSVRTEGFNQDLATVITFRRTLLVYRRGYGPTIPRRSREESPATPPAVESRAEESPSPEMSGGDPR
jgi:itaconyl-CoA hydratase